jgi:two-component system sensor histidine kinase KdpD
MSPVTNTLRAALIGKMAVGASPRGYVVAIVACCMTAAIATPLSDYFDLANIVMLFLLAVALVAVRLGRGPAVMAAFLSVALFDFFFVPPRWSFAVSDAQYLLTFGVMLTVALLIGQLTAGLKQQALLASIKEQRTRALYEMARELAGALTTGQVTEILGRFVREVAHADAALLLPDRQGELHAAANDGDAPRWIEPRMARIAFENTECTDLDAPRPVCYFPLTAPTRVRGVLAVVTRGEGSALLYEHHDVLQTVASLVAIAVERLHYVEVAGDAQLQMVSERLRSSILSAVSHDLRTPLTALVGLADTLAVGRPQLPAQQRETAEALRDQAIRLSGMVGNLLDMARLSAGEVRLRREWQPLEEVIGSSIKLLERNLLDHPVKVDLPATLPLLEFDAVLIERALCNLLENAAKYAPPGSPIDISARRRDSVVEISVCDHGPGIPAGRAQEIFGMFVRGDRESAKPGVGLGLAICRAIVEAHGGSIAAHDAPHGGACFTFTLPAGNPPLIEAEESVAGGAHE